MIAVSSIEGYGAPIIDIMHWWLGSPLSAVVGTMRNFVPDRIIRDTGQMTRANIDDGDMWIAEFGSGALASIQSSYVTVGNYPGIEARIYGSEGAIIVRLVDEFGICQTIKTAQQGRGGVHRGRDPGQVLPAGRHSGEPWEFLFYSNLVTDFISEILDGQRGPPGRLRARARWSRRRSTRSRRRSASAPGSTSRSTRPAHRGGIVNLNRQPGAAGHARCSPARSGPRWPTGTATGSDPDGQPFVLPGMGGGHARRALRRPGDRVRLRPPGAGRVDQAPRPGREHGRCSS